MEQLLCPKCGTVLTEDAHFCPTCGEDVREYIRKIKIERQKQLEPMNKGKQTVSAASGTHTLEDDSERIEVLKRFLAAFCFTLAASVIGIIALLFGGLI